MKQIERFFKEMQQKKVAFIGVGVTNTDIIRIFLKKGIGVTLLDKKQPEQLGDIYNELNNAGVSFRLGESYLDDLSDFDVIFRSPGMYFNHPKLIEARKNGVAVTTEMEVFFELCPCKIYAVTGSDGKTTTTSVITEFLSASGITVHKGGNIGRALLPIIEDIKETDAAVVE
ncbi:MAG: UDP-N-acetylmuramoyl-L-alanine--D-glutamate ligase, partial [Ruminococcus sp.]